MGSQKLPNLLLSLFIGLFLFLHANSTFAQACNDDAGCNLCAGEICFQGQCTFWTPEPCNRDCEVCTQNGDQFTCVPNDDFCEGLTGQCLTGTCDVNSDYTNNPSGCDFVLVTDLDVCDSCLTCGNGICEPDEDTTNCAEDCANPEFASSNVVLPKSSCGPIDLAEFAFSECEDGDVCTDDICDLPPGQLGGTCQYAPKSCSGATEDRCCPAGCSGDPADNNFDTDCCVPPPPPGGEEPTPTPTPTPQPNPTPTPESPEAQPNPSEPGPQQPPAAVGVFIQGGGGCSLSSPAVPMQSALPTSMGVVVLMVFWTLRRYR